MNLSHVLQSKYMRIFGICDHTYHFRSHHNSCSFRSHLIRRGIIYPFFFLLYPSFPMTVSSVSLLFSFFVIVQKYVIFFSIFLANEKQRFSESLKVLLVPGYCVREQYNRLYLIKNYSHFQPRIDPQKLLTCISVLLAPNGGIRSSGEVKRLAR